MPFTPFHLGPALLLGLLLFSTVSLPAFLIGSVIADVEGFSAIFLGVNYPIHGYLHTFAGAFVASILLAGLIYGVRKPINKVMSALRLQQEITFGSAFLGSLLGTFSHVLLDSFLYTDITPFFPGTFNPLAGLISLGTIYILCVVALLLGLVYYMIKFLVKK